MNELPNSAMGVLKIMPSSASQVAQFSMQIVKAVENGNANALEVLVMMRSLEAVSELVREELEEHFEKEADKYAEKKFPINGAFVEKAELGTKYNYLKTGDIEWEQLDSELRSLKEKVAEREAFLKSLREPMTLVNQQTGEVYTVKPPLKTSKSGVKVYLR